MRLWRLAIGFSLTLFVVRLMVARGLGFADAEALYVSYALHPQPAYLDHPGLIGVFARWLGSPTAPPRPMVVHTFTAAIATLIPWIGWLAARAAGATAHGALRAVLALALVPEISIGLFSLVPDLPLAAAWLGALGLGALLLRREAHSFGTLLLYLALGTVVGLGTLSKVSNALLGVALLVTWCGRDQRAKWRSLGPWAALGVATILVLPLVLWQVRHGWPMVMHRLVSSQAGAGVSLRNVGALFGGQLLYVTPFFLIGAGYLLRDVYRERQSDPVSRLFWYATMVPGVVLTGLCLWSRVAEPHWLAPAYLALAVQVGRRDPLRASIKVGAVVTGVAAVALTWMVVKTPLLIRVLGSFSSYRARYDLTNDLYAWGPGRNLLSSAVRDAILESQQLPVVVGPHWTVCAQAQVALGSSVPVGCNSPIRDDFDDWLPRVRWLRAPVLLFVTDDRFAIDETREFSSREVRSIRRVDVVRDGRVVRTIRVTRLDKVSDVAHAEPPANGPTQTNPAFSSSECLGPCYALSSCRRPAPWTGLQPQ